MNTGKTISVVFYRADSGNEPVKEWLKKLSIEERKMIGENIKTVEFTWPLGLPLVRKLDRDLWKVRVSLPQKIARVFFTVEEELMILLHGIIKKSQKTPKEDLELAKKRRDNFLRGQK